MKARKIVIAGLIAAMSLSYAYAGRIVLSLIGPAYSASNVTLSAAGSGVRNCLRDIDITSDAQFTFRILDGATTAYAVIVGSGGAIVRSWSDPSPFCGSANTAMYLNVSAGNPNINYSGFTGQ